MPSFKYGFFKIIFLFIASLTVTVLLLEGTIRIIAPQNVAVKHFISAFGIPAAWKANLQAKRPFFVSPYNITTDDKHLRNFKKINYAKSDDTFRILCLGGSILSAVGVENDETFAYYLDQLLNKRINGKKFEVINAGVPGWELFEFYTYFKNEGYKFSPDLVTMINYTGEIKMLDLPNIEFDEMQAERIGDGRLKIFLKGLEINLHHNPVAAAITRTLNKIPFYESLSQVSHLTTLVHDKINKQEIPSADEVKGSQESFSPFWNALEAGENADWIIENHEYKNIDKNKMKNILYAITLGKFLGLVVQKKSQLVALYLPATDQVLGITKFRDANRASTPSNNFYPFNLAEQIAQFQKDKPFSIILFKIKV